MESLDTHYVGETKRERERERVNKNSIQEIILSLYIGYAQSRSACPLAWLFSAPTLSLPFSPHGLWLIRRHQIKHHNRLGFLRSVFSLVRVGCLQPVFGLVALVRRFALAFSKRSEIEFIIRLGITVFSSPFVLPSMVLWDFFQGFSPPQVCYVEVSQPKRT